MARKKKTKTARGSAPTSTRKRPISAALRSDGTSTVDVSTPEKFCAAWAAAPTLDELEKQTGINRRTLTGRAASYRRKKNIPLKFFGSGESRLTNWKALAEKYTKSRAAKSAKNKSDDDETELKKAS